MGVGKWVNEGVGAGRVSRRARRAEVSAWIIDGEGIGGTREEHAKNERTNVCSLSVSVSVCVWCVSARLSFLSE